MSISGLIHKYNVCCILVAQSRMASKWWCKLSELIPRVQPRATEDTSIDSLSAVQSERKHGGFQDRKA